MRMVLIWALLAGPAFADDIATTETAAPRPIVTQLIERSSASLPSFVGVVAARTQTDLGFPVIGTVASRVVDIGDLVAAGDLIAQLDPEDFDADLRTAKAGVLVSSAQLHSAKDAEERARNLVARGTAANTRLEDASRQLTAAQARYDQAEASLARAQDIRGYATLTAPQDGVITQTFAEPGATLQAGAPIVTLAGTDTREIVLDLLQQDVAALDVGTAFNISLLVDEQVTATAILHRIDPITERTTRTRRLHLTLEDAGPGFRLGALVKVRMKETSKSSLSLPLSAVLDADGNAQVWIIDRTSDKATLRSVTLGQGFGDHVRILGGLNPGEEIVIKGIHSLKEGQIVGPSVTP